MTQNWIIGAQNKVLADAKAKQADHLAKRQARARTIHIFEEKLAKVKLEIEEVLEEARRQGFGVEGPVINYSAQDTSPLYLWKVHDYGQGKSYTIVLYLVDRQGTLVPSNTAQDVEKDIQEWLYRIYSKN